MAEDFPVFSQPIKEIAAETSSLQTPPTCWECGSVWIAGQRLQRPAGLPLPPPPLSLRGLRLSPNIHASTEKFARFRGVLADRLG